MATELFKNIPSKVGDLVRDVRIGKIGLPDLQRPFVWKDNKIRELYDSMLKGYPIGYIICCYEGKIWKPESILPRSDRRILRSSKKPCSR